MHSRQAFVSPLRRAARARRRAPLRGQDQPRLRGDRARRARSLPPACAHIHLEPSPSSKPTPRSVLDLGVASAPKDRLAATSAPCDHTVEAVTSPFSISFSTSGRLGGVSCGRPRRAGCGTETPRGDAGRLGEAREERRVEEARRDGGAADRRPRGDARSAASSRRCPPSRPSSPPRRFVRRRRRRGGVDDHATLAVRAARFRRRGGHDAVTVNVPIRFTSITSGTGSSPAGEPSRASAAPPADAGAVCAHRQVTFGRRLGDRASTSPPGSRHTPRTSPSRGRSGPGRPEGRGRSLRPALRERRGGGGAEADARRDGRRHSLGSISTSVRPSSSEADYRGYGASNDGRRPPWST